MAFSFFVSLNGLSLIMSFIKIEFGFPGLSSGWSLEGRFFNPLHLSLQESHWCRIFRSMRSSGAGIRISWILFNYYLSLHRLFGVTSRFYVCGNLWRILRMKNAWIGSMRAGWTQNLIVVWNITLAYRPTSWLIAIINSLIQNKCLWRFII